MARAWREPQASALDTVEKVVTGHNNCNNCNCNNNCDRLCGVYSPASASAASASGTLA